MVENQFGKRSKVLRLDNGGEYMFGGFIDLCSEVGIKKVFAVPYNPQ